ncbi:MAG: tRNA threonylcarbamoyladenosine dehydratase [Treponema sp.]|nr:tRNA threonylcarbamoyladenosine dehydratase [Treponema sp.]MBQ8679691.1 tRNA threonylcarbamoyladenosine dehydratase [Treponema sp.]
MNQFSRTELLLGKEAMKILSRAHVAVFGVGGVGGYVIEALVRSGISHIDIIDNDTVSLTNINRQIIASHSTIGKAKVDVMKERILDINPDAEVKAFKCFYLPETRNLFDFSEYDYVVDAVDTVTAKIQLILQAKEAVVPVISSMGAGNKLNPMSFEVADISQTSVCPLARVMRQECKKRGIKDVKVVYSREKPVESRLTEEEKKSAEQKGNGVAPGSCAFVPSVAGLIIAGEVIKDLTAKARNV